MKKKAAVVDGKFRHMAFFELLADAAYQHILATKSEDGYSAKRHVRASIIASALSVESVANCLLSYLQLPPKTLDDYDKMPVLSKIDTYTLLTKREVMNRGDNRVNRISDLIKARNGYAHPKQEVLPVEVGPMQDAGCEWHMPMQISGKDLPGLKIPSSSKFWSTNNSFAVLSALHDFYKYIFENVLKFSNDEIFSVLIDRVEVRNIQIPIIDPELTRDIQALKSLGVDFTKIFPMLREDTASEHTGVLAQNS